MKVEISTNPTINWRLRLFIVGQAPRSLAAQMNLRALCDRFVSENYAVEIIDLLKYPGAACEANVVAVPMTLRLCPEPVIRVIGDLSDLDRAAISLGFISPS